MQASRFVGLIREGPSGSVLRIPGRASHQCPSVSLHKAIQLTIAASKAVLTEGIKGRAEAASKSNRTLIMLAGSGGEPLFIERAIEDNHLEIWSWVTEAERRDAAE